MKSGDVRVRVIANASIERLYECEDGKFRWVPERVEVTEHAVPVEKNGYADFGGISMTTYRALLALVKETYVYVIREGQGHDRQ